MWVYLCHKVNGLIQTKEAKMNTVTFSKDEYGDCLASTGERIAKYRGTELWGRGSTGWYITEVNGEFLGWKFDTLRDAKNSIIRRHNPMQWIEATIKTFAPEIVGA